MMATQKSMLTEFAWDQRYEVSSVADVLTPALLLYPEILVANIDRTVELLGGDPNRWRVHIKTAKLGYAVRTLVARGIRNFECATTLELLLACQCGAADVLLAYPSVGANAHRVQAIAAQFPDVQISILAENAEQVRQWRASQVGIFLDINPGMNRTGIDQDNAAEIINLVREIAANSLSFRGLHYYDGQYGAVAEPERTEQAHAGYHHLMNVVNEVERSGTHVPEVITAGTPTFPCSLSFNGFRNAGFIHRVSPGTIVYCDASSLAQLPGLQGYRPAVLVLARVVSRPRENIVTCDAGHKAVSADAGVPTCIVIGHPELTPRAPSEEHLPLAVQEEATAPKVAEALYLLPRHICPTVNNFDDALLVRQGSIESIEDVSARGHEPPLLRTIKKPPLSAVKKLFAKSLDVFPSPSHHRQCAHHIPLRRARAYPERITCHQCQSVLGSRRQHRKIRCIDHANQTYAIGSLMNRTPPAVEPRNLNGVALRDPFQRQEPTRTMPGQQQISRLSKSRATQHVRWTKRQRARSCALQNNFVVAQPRNLQPRNRPQIC